MASTNDIAALSQEVQRSAPFQELRRSFVTFIAPLTALFLLWYLVYVLLACFAPQLFAVPVFGVINVGILLGLGQFVSTFAITMLYRSWANNRYDAKAAVLREQIESGTFTSEEA